jgi:nitronate monooxygenase
VTQGDYDDLKSQGRDQIIGEQDGQPVYLFSTDSPLQGASGDLDDMALYAGQSCGAIDTIESAGRKVQKLVADTERALYQASALG